VIYQPIDLPNKSAPPELGMIALFSVLSRLSRRRLGHGAPGGVVS
jgi:hypothetical protein